MPSTSGEQPSETAILKKKQSKQSNNSHRLLQQQNTSNKMEPQGFSHNRRNLSAVFSKTPKIREQAETNFRLPPLRCDTLNQHNLEELLLSTLICLPTNRSPIMLYKDQEALISLVHRATELIANYDSMLITIPESMIVPMSRLFVVGSLDGDFNYLLTIFNQCLLPPFTTYVFLGDYLNTSGSNRADVLLLLLSLKLRFPRHIILLRGHHETYEMCKATNFDVFCRSKRLFNAFMLLFEYLPIVAVLGQFLCLHSGLSPFLTEPESILNFARPVEIKRMTISERCLLTDILYGTPDAFLLPHFAPSSDYPIGFRFNIVALFIVLFLFDCKKLIRGCGARELGILFDFDCVFSFAIASGGETDHGGSIFGKHVIQIQPSARAILVKLEMEKVWQTLNYDRFIDELIYILRNEPYNYEVPSKCLICKWEGQGKKPENVIISHTELSDFSQTMSDSKIDERYLLDPRIKQYLYCEIFPFCIDYYFYGQQSLAVKRMDYLTYGNPFVAQMIERPKRLKPGQFNSLNQSYEHFIIEWDDNWPYPYINRIVRPGYDLQKPKLDENDKLGIYDDRQKIQQRRGRSTRRVPNFHSYREWIRSINAPLLTYQYRVERLPFDNDDYDE